MAIVREFTARNGVHVKVADDCYAHLTPEEHAARVREINRRIWQILIDEELRKAARKEERQDER